MMKKKFVIAGMLVVGSNLAYSQKGNVGINTETPQATLDIKPNATNLATSATTNEGILLPRLSRVRLENITTANLVESTLVYVDDITAPAAITTTTDVTSKGFYYYDGTSKKWIKLAEGVIQEQDLRLVGTNNHITQDAGVGSNGTSVGTGIDNIAIGEKTLSSNTIGNNNFALGKEALASNTTGHNNIAIGRGTLKKSQNSHNNIAMGSHTLTDNIGIHNIGIGSNSLQHNTIGNANIGMGVSALYANTTGHNNIAIGEGALKTNTSGYHNVGIGSGGVEFNSTGSHNVAVGHLSLRNNRTGNGNLVMGAYALTNNISGDGNTALGKDALFNNTIGKNNTAIGFSSMKNNVSGENNIAIGHNSGQWIKGHNSIHIGNNTTTASTVSASELDNVILIANIDNGILNTLNSRDNSILLGDDVVTSTNMVKVGIGTYKPDAKLHINSGTNSGAIKITDGTQGAGKVLTSDANGLATWKDPTGHSTNLISQRATNTTNVTLVAGVATDIPGFTGFTAQKAGKHMITYHSFLSNPKYPTAEEKSFYFAIYKNGTRISNNETYNYVLNWFNSHYFTIIDLAVGDVVTYKITAQTGAPLVLPASQAGRNTVEIVYLGQ